MKNKDFFYLQYDKLKWENQEKTKINSFVNSFIAQNIILKRKASTVKVFDIGFGIGFFLKMLAHTLPRSFKEVVLEGCEPSDKNYRYFKSKPFTIKKGVNIRTFNKTFLNTNTDTKFDFIVSTYTFTAFVLEELEKSTKKIYSMLERDGKFILVVANEKYLEEKLSAKRDLFIEKNSVELDGNKYNEVLHYSEIPQIGTVIDYNREEKFYIKLFTKYGFDLKSKKNLDDNGFLCTIFVFSKM